MNYEERIVVRTRDLNWKRDPDSGHDRRQLDELTCLLRVAPGQELSFDASDGIEGVLLDGSLSYPSDELEQGTYFRLPPGTNPVLQSQNGCTLFLKEQPFTPGDTARVIKPTRGTPWLAGQGRLEVMPLHEHGTRSSALVRWPAGERFVPHRHFGGEEIFVLSGTFMDEHGIYPAGCWLSTPFHNYGCIRTPMHPA